MVSSSLPPLPPNDTVLKINGKDSSNTRQGANSMYRDSSYDFSNDVVMRAAANSKDFDFGPEIPESPKLKHGLLSPREFRISINERPEPAVPRRSTAEPDEVLVCSSNNSFRRKASMLMRTKTKSRLLEQPDEEILESRTQRTGRESQVTCKGMMNEGEEEDDPFLEEDLPDEYKKMNFSVFSVLQLVSLILIIGALICSLFVNVLKKRSLFGLKLWKWELMVLVLICGRLVSGSMIRIVVFFIERNFLLRKRVLYFVYGLRKAVQNCIWLGLVLIAWQCIFDKKVEKVTDKNILPYVSKIWICLLLGTVIWLLKTLLIKVLASSFHVSTFFDRIQESLFNQYVIVTLSGPPSVAIQREREEEERVMVEFENFQRIGATIPADLKANIIPKSGRIIGTSPRMSEVPVSGKSHIFSTHLKKDEHHGITIDDLQRLNQRNISAWNMKRLMNIVKNGRLTTLDEKLKGSGGEDETMVQITSENHAKAAAKKIFANVAKPESKYIYKSDLMRFMQEEEVAKTINLFDGVNDVQGISKRALKDWVVNAFRERRALAYSLNDTKTAVNKLHQIINVLVAVIILVFWLLILKVATRHFFVLLSSQFLLVVFVFGNTCKTTFEAIIFLFVMHPFDVGDSVEVDGVQMVVEEMNILTTVFLKSDNHKIYYPNSSLATKAISNYYRSPDMKDSVEFRIHISTPPEKIALMKERITSYVDSKSDYWEPEPNILVKEIEEMDKLKWTVGLTHRINFQDMGERWARRALLIEEMVKIFRELDIEHRVLPSDETE